MATTGEDTGGWNRSIKDEWACRDGVVNDTEF
jgi:hypothetical protein